MSDSNEKVVEPLSREEEVAAATARIKQEVINMVMRQTDYEEETAREKLEACDYKFDVVIREYLSGGAAAVDQRDTKIESSVNQGIYSEIRNLMDTASATFRRKQEATRMYQERMAAAAQAQSQSQPQMAPVEEGDPMDSKIETDPSE